MQVHVRNESFILAKIEPDHVVLRGEGEKTLQIELVNANNNSEIPQRLQKKDAVYGVRTTAEDLEENAFLWNANIIFVIITDVVSIHARAFKYATNVSVVIFDSPFLEFIETCAFMYTRIQSVYIESYNPDQQLTIGEKAFANNLYLKDITIITGSLKLFDEVFSNTGVQRIRLSFLHSDGGLPPRMCANCKSLTNFEASPFEVVGSYCFEQCTSLERFYIPEECFAVAKCAFIMCDNLKKVYGNKGTRLIETGAFLGCASLTQIFLGGVLKIGTRALKGTNLLHLALPNVLSVSKSAFESAGLITALLGPRATIHVSAFDYNPLVCMVLPNQFISDCNCQECETKRPFRKSIKPYNPANIKRLFFLQHGISPQTFFLMPFKKRQSVRAFFLCNQKSAIPTVPIELICMVLSFLTWQNIGE